MKRCTACLQDKSISEFYLRSGKPVSRCKPCARTKQESWRKRNPHHFSEWQRSNREARSAYNEKWRSTKPGLKKALQAVANATRAARRHGISGRITARDLLALVGRSGGACLACGATEWTIDHVVPLSLGGANTIDNIQILCGPCNSSKKQKAIDFRRTGMLG